jgi:phage-related protein
MANDFTKDGWCPDIPASREEKWRLRTAKFGDGYEERVLDGINALDEKWSVKFSNRPKDTILAMDRFLKAVGANSFQFYERDTQGTIEVYCDGWLVEWANKSAGESLLGTLTVDLRRVYSHASPTNAPDYALPIATDVTLGGVKSSKSVMVDAMTGVMSATPASIGAAKAEHNHTIGEVEGLQEALEGATGAFLPITGGDMTGPLTAPGISAVKPEGVTTLSVTSGAVTVQFFADATYTYGGLFVGGDFYVAALGERKITFRTNDIDRLVIQSTGAVEVKSRLMVSQDATDDLEVIPKRQLDALSQRVDDIVAAGGGATTLEELSDVDLTTTPPTGNEVLTFDAEGGLWVPKTPATGVDLTARVEALEARCTALEEALAGKVNTTGDNTITGTLTVTGEITGLTG